MVNTRKTLMSRSLFRIGALLTALFLMLSACVPAVQDTAEEPLGKSENQESGAIESPADTPTPTAQVLRSTVRATELIPVTPSDPVGGPGNGLVMGIGWGGRKLSTNLNKHPFDGCPQDMTH